jgi:hypothetical protein
MRIKSKRYEEGLALLSEMEKLAPKEVLESREGLLGKLVGLCLCELHQDQRGMVLERWKEGIDSATHHVGSTIASHAVSTSHEHVLKVAEHATNEVGAKAGKALEDDTDSEKVMSRNEYGDGIHNPFSDPDDLDPHLPASLKVQQSSTTSDAFQTLREEFKSSAHKSRKLEEWERKEADWARRQEEWKRLQMEYEAEQAEWTRQQEEWRRQQAEWEREQDEFDKEQSESPAEVLPTPLLFCRRGPEETENEDGIQDISRHVQSSIVTPMRTRPTPNQIEVSAYNLIWRNVIQRLKAFLRPGVQTNFRRIEWTCVCINNSAPLNIV